MGNGPTTNRGAEAGPSNPVGPAGRGGPSAPKHLEPRDPAAGEAGRAAPEAASPDAAATRLRDRLLGGRPGAASQNPPGNGVNPATRPLELRGAHDRQPPAADAPSLGDNPTSGATGRGPAGRGTPGHPELILPRPRDGQGGPQDPSLPDPLPTPLREKRGDAVREHSAPDARGPLGERGPNADRGPQLGRSPQGEHAPPLIRVPDKENTPGGGRGPDETRAHRAEHGPGARGPSFEWDRAGPRGEPGRVATAHRAGPPSKFAQRVESGELQKVVRGETAAKLRLEEQYRLAAHGGDYARRLELHKNVERITQINKTTNITNIHNVTNITNTNVNVHLGGRPYYYGRVAPHYHRDCFEWHYWGHRFFAGVCWYPRWTPWVRWSWYYSCEPVWDPRPIWCRPIVYVPAPVWVYYPVPVWQPLPECESGTWVDVAKVEVGPRPDVQLLAVRLVDPGHPDEKLGPRYRIWIRNNGEVDIDRPFNVVALTSSDGRLAPGLPQAGVRVQAVRAGETQSFDIRLPVECYAMGRDAEGQPIPFATLHVIADADRELAEATRTNNGANIARENVFPVDPAVFGADPKEAVEGGEVVLAGEGLGPRPGQVLVNIDGVETEAEILGWFDLGVRVTLPKLPAGAGRREVQLIVVRGDGAAANPIGVIVAPAPGAAMGPRPQAVEPMEPQAGPVFPQ